MNWIEIKKECPKAWELCEKWYIATFGDKDLTLSELGFLLGNQRNLYDFLDNLGVYVNTENIGSRAEPHFRSCVRSFLDTSRNVWLNPTGVPTRKEAEEEAFTQSFKLLEPKL